MKISLLTFQFLLVSLSRTIIHAAPPKGQELTSSYTFETYLIDFDKVNKYDTDEYQTRKENFERNLKLVLQHNTKNAQYRKGTKGGGGGGGHTLGLNHFSDWNEQELQDQLLGHDKSHRYEQEMEKRTAESTFPTTRTAIARYLRSSSTSSSKKFAPHELPLPFDVTEIDTLPEEVDWTEYSTPIKNQGGCGSCWAFASTAALESHLAIHVYNQDPNQEVLEDTPILSPQEMVSCVENPNDCGGEGGCQGATAELAYAFIADSGMILEADFPYTGGDKIECPMNKNVKPQDDDDWADDWEEDDDSKGPTVLAYLEGYAKLPTNDYKALMNAVAKWGPVTISVAASTWAFYEGGVFTPPNLDLPSAWDINHGVVLEGYGTDDETGEKYWLVRNSWGESWGEGGRIRLKREDPEDEETNMTEFCGLDKTPADGTVCRYDDTGRAIPLWPVSVCGTNGMLFDSVIPVHGHL